MQRTAALPCLLLFMLFAGGRVSATASPDSDAILSHTEMHGGMCLIVGAEDTALAEAVAAERSFYVQQLVPDQKQIVTWSKKSADSELRERIGLREAMLRTDDYGSDLFNLIVIRAWPKKDAPTLAELARILTPQGVLAVQDPPATLAAEARSATLRKMEGPASWALFEKPTITRSFEPADCLKWRAGSRWQRMGPHALASLAFGHGKLVYREGMAHRGGGHRFELICRDAYNGRVRWRIEEPAFTEKEWRGRLRKRMGLAIGSDGNVTTGLGEDFVCLDGGTGKILSRKEGARPSTVLAHPDGYLLIDRAIVEIKSGREIGKVRGGKVCMAGGQLYVGDGKLFTAYQISSGKVLWEVNVQADQPKGQFQGMFCSDEALHVRRGWPAASLSTMDRKTGATQWTWPPPPRPKVRDVLAYARGTKLFVAYSDPSISTPHDFVFREFHAATGKVINQGLYGAGKKWSGGCWSPRLAGDYLLYHHNTWLDLRTFERTARVLFRPMCKQGPLPRNGMLYAFPGRKGGSIKGVIALGPRDLELNQDTGGKILKTYAAASAVVAASSPRDWPMFRGNVARGNASATSIGTTLKSKWTTAVGLGQQTYGTMDAERTGLTQAVCVNGLAVVADIDGQRVVGMDAETGAIRWTFFAGSRIAFSPTLHKGLCLFGAKDGWVTCLDASSGKLVYRLLIAPRERFVGGQEKLESLWPVCGDVLVADGLAYANAGYANAVHGGIRVVAFRPRTGEVVWSQCVHGEASKSDREVPAGLLVWNEKRGQVELSGMAFDPATGKPSKARPSVGTLFSVNMEDWLSTNNLNRLSEDMGHLQLRGGHVGGRLIAFDDQWGVGFNVAREGKTIFHTGEITISGRSADGTRSWTETTSGLNVDDLLVTPDAVYCVGHYERKDQPAELRVLSRRDGKLVAVHKLEGFPAYNGLSAAGDKLFISTRDGGLICFSGK